MKFERTEVFGWEAALRGMRNPKASWSKSDTTFDKNNNVKIGENDMKLALNLVKAGTEHRKFLRMIHVQVDITAPLYWWKEFDTYKVSTVANSTSTMHKLASTPITLECFDIDDWDMKYSKNFVTNYLIKYLEELRVKYNETNDKKYWKELIRWLPDGWLQTRTIDFNYETIRAMCGKGQRRFHKLNEWSGNDDNKVPNFISWARTLPYAQEFLFTDELE